ncbi:hypothetical protein Tco_1092583 [Tanacetum coccineum]|uniref:Uncharacterized protein n=1 Tax=Tanacetum coccineum TaxID=301880 RepID=A0ABQ5IBK8_9ASTR
MISLNATRLQRFTSTNWRHPWDPYSIYQSVRIMGPLLRQGSGDKDGTPPISKEYIEGTRTIVTGKEVGDAYLKRPFKKMVKSSLTQRIIEFVGPKFKLITKIKSYNGTNDLEDHLSRFTSAANSGEWPMLFWCHMFQQTLNGNARGWFECLPAGMPEATKKVSDPVSRREYRFYRGGYKADRWLNDGRNTYNNGEGIAPYRPPYQAHRGDPLRHDHPRLNLNLLTKHPKEILASKLQLNLSPPMPMKLPPKIDTMITMEKRGTYTNDCFQLRR